jgi:hypothetical protein
MIKLFIEQRSRDKYQIYKMDEDKVKYLYSNDAASPIDDKNRMIDFVQLQSVSGDTYYFITTGFELCNAEKLIQRMVRKHCSFDKSNNIEKTVKLFMCLKDEYIELLYYIGYRPKELDILFPSADYNDNIDNIQSVEDCIDDAYEIPYNKIKNNIIDSLGHRPGGLNTIPDIASKIVYSFEAFIKVLKDDL